MRFTELGRWSATRRVTAAVIGAMLVITGSAVLAAGPAAAATPAIDAFLLRDGAQSLYRQDGLGGTEVHAGLENEGNVLAARFYSPSADNQPDVEITMTSGLAPGTYSVSRTPGQAQALLDLQSFDNCGSDGTGTLTVDRASWAPDGTPTLLDASFERDTCQGLPAVHGIIRWHSDTPLGVASAPESSKISATVVVNSSADLPVTVTAAGNAPTTFGTLAVRQTAASDGTDYWTVGSDTCSGKTLDAGSTCTITMHVAPLRPNGYPTGEIDATLVLPDGQPDPVFSTVSATVKPLGGQPVSLRAVPGVRRVTLSWLPPQALGDGWTGGKPITYAAYQVAADGTATEVRSVITQTALSIPEPDRFTGTFYVRAREPGTDLGPQSVPVTTATAHREALIAENEDGLATLSLDPPAAPSVFVDPYSEKTASDPTIGGLTVARDQSLLAYTHAFTYPGGTKASTVVATQQLRGDIVRTFGDQPTDKTTTFRDSNPSLSPDGSRIVFARSQNGVTSLQIGRVAPGFTVSTIPGSASLSQPTFSSDGRSVIAVRTTNVVTKDLVQVDPVSGMQTPIPNTTGLTQPDVAADGHLVAVRWATVNGSTVSELVTLPRGGEPTVVPGTDSGWNLRPRFSPDARTIFYGHAADSGSPSDAYSVEAASGTVTSYSQGGGASTPFVLTEDAPDSTAPTAAMTGPTSATALGTTVTASWSSADPSVLGAVTSGVGSGDVRLRTASYGGAFSGYSYPAAWQHTTRTSVSAAAHAGVEYCFSVRSRDRAGNVSAWSGDRCTTEPIDDRALTTKATRTSGASYFGRTASRARATHTSFTRTKVSASHVAVLAVGCRGCGAVDVWIGRTYLGRVNTAAAHTRYQQLFWLRATKSFSGTLMLRTTSKAQVLLDGVVTVR